MRILLAALLATFGFIGVAQADPFANFYGNTTVVAHPKNGERKVHINEDGTYSQTLADGSTVTGTWKLDGDTACFMQDAAAADAQPYCVPAEARNVGDSWDLTAPDGTVEKATLVAGQ